MTEAEWEIERQRLAPLYEREAQRSSNIILSLLWCLGERRGFGGVCLR